MCTNIKYHSFFIFGSDNYDIPQFLSQSFEYFQMNIRKIKRIQKRPSKKRLVLIIEKVMIPKIAKIWSTTNNRNNTNNKQSRNTRELAFKCSTIERAPKSLEKTFTRTIVDGALNNLNRIRKVLIL